MTINEAIESLKQYIKQDEMYQNYKKEIPQFKSDFDEFCIKHCEAIETLLNEYKKRYSNNVINVYRVEHHKKENLFENYYSIYFTISTSKESYYTELLTDESGKIQGLTNIPATLYKKYDKDTLNFIENILIKETEQYIELFGTTPIYEDE